MLQIFPSPKATLFCLERLWPPETLAELAVRCSDGALMEAAYTATILMSCLQARVANINLVRDDQGRTMKMASTYIR